jgi:hypothetical protein
MFVNRLPAVIVVAIVVLLVAYLFQLWARHHRRLMIHRERLASLEKGIDLPPLVEQEIQRGSWNVQRLLLLAGLCWLSVGITALATLMALEGAPPFQVPWGYDTTGQTVWVDMRVHDGMQWLALAPIGVGLSHLIVYFTGRRQG